MRKFKVWGFSKKLNRNIFYFLAAYKQRYKNAKIATSDHQL